MKKIFYTLFCIATVFSLATGCGNKNLTEKDVIAAINKVVNNYYDKAINENKQTSMTIKDFKNQLDTYSDYKLIDKSGSEFTSKPTEPNYIIEKFYESDQINNSNNTDIKRYFLIYNEKNKTYYGVLCDWDKDSDRPIFVEAKELK